MRKFDFAIGNPAYQAETKGENDTYAPPVYDKFLESAFQIADKVEMVHPARFLFNAGSTPKAWNEKMLADTHFKVLHYEADCSKMFSNTEIKGGVAITYHDNAQSFGPIGIFTPYELLNSVLKKVQVVMEDKNLVSSVVNSYSYHFTDALHTDFPNAEKLLSKGHAYDLKSNVMEKLPMVFSEKLPNDGEAYVGVWGRIKNERVVRYIKSQYLNNVINLHKYKVFLPAASGNGELGEELASPYVVGPNFGSTETFCSIGCFDTDQEAQNALKYIKSKFARSMLSVLKVTQHITPDKFKYVPLQDFTSGSDINWHTSIANIDRQLYKKYGLSQEEIDFIETHVKEMT